ncbi:MAG: HEPN domain-containing protein [Sphingobacteriales bacterium]|nr:HEPN domain-containing protein [Sphingobacteriales bacterium]OJY92387.1 MAG: hypothetical protein BGP14_14390 [Sphingobacteriales bacterium 44-15]
MRTTPIHQHTAAFAAYHLAIVDRIVKAAAPDSIFLLGLKIQQTKADSIFHSTLNSSAFIADVWLLVLLRNFDNKSRQEWQDKIEAHCNMLVPATTIVLQEAVFREEAENGNSFACTVLRSADRIYSVADIKYPEVVLSGPDTQETNSLLSAGISKAREFLAGAELYRLRKQYNLSAFMLHQSAEQSLLALLLVAMGFRANTHNVERLLRYGSFLSGALTEIFLSHREEDKKLIKLLQKAYIDTRYGKEYIIQYSDLVQLTEKVMRIADIAASTGKQILNTLTSTLQYEKQY